MIKVPMLKKRKIFFSYNLKKINLFKCLFLLFLVGFVVGTMLIIIDSEKTLQQLDFLVKNFIKTRRERPFFSTYISSFFNSAFLMAIIFILGFLPFSQPVSFFIPIFYGLGIGIFISYLYCYEKLKTIVCFLSMFIPCQIIYVLILLLSIKISIKFSNKNFNYYVLKKRNEKTKKDYKLYFMRFLTILVFQFFAAFVDVLTSFIFVRFLI